MRAIDLKVAVRVALLYGIRGFARGRIAAGDASLAAVPEAPPRPAVGLAIRDMFAAVCSDFKTSPEEYDALILEFFEKDFRQPHEGG